MEIGSMDQLPRALQAIGLHQLEIDEQNPRVPEIEPAANAALKELFRSMPDKIVTMATHIAENGLNPAATPLVVPSTVAPGQFVVLDGNRRITALKVLANPDLVTGIATGAQMRRLKTLSEGIYARPSLITCHVFATREEAEPWIRLIHLGEANGAGLVEWDAQMTARFDERSGQRKRFEVFVLDYVRQHGDLLPETAALIDSGRYPITNIQRLLNSPSFRKAIQYGSLHEIRRAAEEGTLREGVLDVLTRMVDDFGGRRKDFSVSRIHNKTQREEYFQSLVGIGPVATAGKEEQAERKQGVGFNAKVAVTDQPTQPQLPIDGVIFGTDPAVTAVPITVPDPEPEPAPETDNKELTAEATTAADSTGAVRAQAVWPRSQAPRKTLIPSDWKPRINNEKIRNVLAEIRRLELDEYPHASAVLFRVFLELSVDEFIEKIVGWPSKKIDGTVLAHKVSNVGNALFSEGLINKQQMYPVERAVSEQTALALSIKSWHAIIHSKYYSAKPNELRPTWDDLEPFFTALWKRLSESAR